MRSVKVPHRVDEESFRRLVEENGTILLRICLLYLGDRQLAEDAVQDTFVKAFRAMDTFRGGSDVRTWLTRIAINTCKNYRRARWNRLIFTGEPPERGVDDKPGDAALVAEVARLPRPQKEVVILFYYREMSVEEIARTLGVSQSAVYARLKRARVRLKKRLEGWYFDA